MKIAIALTVFLLSAFPSFAQTVSLDKFQWSGLSREATIDAVAERLTEINRPFVGTGASVAVGWWETSVDEAIHQVMDLRDALASNPYVRVSAFTVGFPWGVSVELSFPEAETADPVADR